MSAKKNINIQEVFLTIAKKIPLVNKEPNNENKKVLFIINELILKFFMKFENFLACPSSMRKKTLLQIKNACIVFKKNYLHIKIKELNLNIFSILIYLCIIIIQKNKMEKKTPPPAKDKKFDFETDEIRSQAISKEFEQLKLLCESQLQELRCEIEKLSENSQENSTLLTSKQIKSFSSKVSMKLSETFTNLCQEIKFKFSKIPVSDKVLNVDYKKFKSSKKVHTTLPTITSVIEYLESENLIVFGGHGKVMILDSFSLEKVSEIHYDSMKLPVLFQYDSRENILFICCMNMCGVEAYKFNKEAKTFCKVFELVNHNLPGVASLKLIDNYLLTGGYDKKLSIWSTDSRKLVKEMFFEEYLVCFEQISSSLLLIGGNESIIVFDISENKVVKSNKIHSGPIWQLIYHALYETIISGSCDTTVKVSSYKEGNIQVLHTFKQSFYSYGVCLLDHEHILTCGKDKILRVYNILNGEKVLENNKELQYDGDWITIDSKLHRAFISETNGIVHIFEEIA